jgi:hypothetical protein
MAGKLQNEDHKTLAEVTGAGGAMAQLLNDAKIYVVSLTKQLSTAFTDGSILLSSLLTTKGDIIARTSTIPARLGVGTNGQVLTADSAQATGLVWATPSGGGAAALVVISKSATYTLLTTEDVVLCTASGGAFTINLPTAVGNSGKVFYIKKVDSSILAVTVDADTTETIDGQLTQVISNQYDNITIVSNGTNWSII